MLVLAMEFSRCALRAGRTSDIYNRPMNGWIGAGERHLPDDPDGVASEGGIASGLPKGRVRGSLPQNGIVMPRCHTQARRPHGRDIQAMCGPPGAG